MDIHFLYGTETGNAEMLCEDIEADLGEGFECTISCLADVAPEQLSAEAFHIFVTSTYGSGDLPATAQPFMDALVNGAPDLSHIRFSIFGLGDMIFAETFNNGSKQLMEQLLECKAQMVGDRGLHDASSMDMPEDVAIPWTHEIIALLKTEAA